MDPRTSAQEVLLCDFCQKIPLQSHCELCQISLCKACVVEHLSDSSKRHNVVPYKHRTYRPNYAKCLSHTQKHCELYCEICDIPVCSTCISSKKHKGHDLSLILQKLRDLENDLNELEEEICPAYKEIELNIKSEKENLGEHYKKLTTAVTKQGEDWHREINIIVNKRKFEINEMKKKHLDVLNKQEKEVKQITSDVRKSILDLKEILDSNDVSLTSAYAYQSKNAKFRSLPPQVKVLLPSFYPLTNIEDLHQAFGSLSPLPITTEEYGYTTETAEPEPFPPIETLLDGPKQLITLIETEFDQLFSVTCLSDEEIWTCGNDKIMQLLNLQGKLLKSIQTKSGNHPCDIAVTRSGDLVYTDPETRTVNIVKNDQIQELIRLQGWRPGYVCSTSSGDLLVTMDSDDDEQSKVVRYSGSTEKQTIQFDEENLLYSSGDSKFISENRNLDICVADYKAKAVVVVNQAGKLRFRYTGQHSSKRQTFKPRGITTDSQNYILTADFMMDCIHILDENGHFLRYIFNSDILSPHALCVDTRNNLFVAECYNSVVKKIKYM